MTGITAFFILGILSSGIFSRISYRTTKLKGRKYTALGTRAYGHSPPVMAILSLFTLKG